jgi:hypothetical protein
MTVQVTVDPLTTRVLVFSYMVGEHGKGKAERKKTKNHKLKKVLVVLTLLAHDLVFTVLARRVRKYKRKGGGLTSQVVD